MTMKNARPLARLAASSTHNNITRLAALACQGAMISQPIILIFKALAKQYIAETTRTTVIR